MDKDEYRRLWLTAASRLRHYGKDDPRTIAAARELAQVRLSAAEAEVARLRAELAAMAAMAS